MEHRTYDAVIVGGRCGGAALAAFLARDGARVAVIDRDELPSDQVISTHTVHPSGTDVLDELGVGDEIRKVCPASRLVRLQAGEAHADIPTPEDRAERCPRRYTLDGLLHDAARAAGAEVIDETRVTEVIMDDGRASGVRAQRRSGEALEFRASITVGADGRHSTVASQVGAEEYFGYDSPRAMYWSYWDPPAEWRSDAYPFDMLLQFNGNKRRAIFSTEEGQLLLGTLPEQAEMKNWRGRHTERYLEDLRSDAVFGPLVEGGTMRSEVRGTVKERYFFRRAVGPGWALVGDAGHHKDPIAGWGISEALHQAKELARAIRSGDEQSFKRYWYQRDVDALPRFRLAEDRGAAGSISRVMPVVLSKANDDPAVAARMYGEVEYDVNPYEILPGPVVARWVVGAALRGRPQLLKAFVQQGRRIQQVQRELKARKKLLESVA